MTKPSKSPRMLLLPGQSMTVDEQQSLVRMFNERGDMLDQYADVIDRMIATLRKVGLAPEPEAK